MIETFDDNASLADVRATLNKVIVGQSINGPVIGNASPDTPTQLSYGVTPVAGTAFDDSFLVLPPALADTRVELTAIFSGTFAIDGPPGPVFIFHGIDDEINGGHVVAWTSAPLALDGDDDVYAAPALVFECPTDGQWLTNGILFDG